MLKAEPLRALPGPAGTALACRPSSQADQGGNLARYSGFPSLVDELDQVFDSVMPRFGGLAGVGAAYPIDLYETSEELVLEMAVPGVERDQLDISLEGRQLSVQGRLDPPEGEERRYWLQGIPRGPFSRTVALPTAVEPDGIQAEVRDGLLTLRLPKIAEARARKIAIEAP